MRSTSTWILLLAVGLAAWTVYERNQGSAGLLEVQAEPRPDHVAQERAAAAAPAAAPPSGFEALRDEAWASGARRACTTAREAGDLVTAAVEARGMLHRLADGPDRAFAEETLEGLERRAVEAANDAARAADPDGQWRELTIAWIAARDEARRERYREILDHLVQAQLFGRGAGQHAVLHRVAAGESLARIAPRYGFTPEGLMRLNRLSSTVIRVGQTLKAPNGPVRIVVWKSEFRLVLFFGDRYVRSYAIGIGKDDSTPEAEFEVEERSVNPVWYAPGGRVFPPGDPGNLLGTRWLGFKDTEAHSGFGIHGTREPASIGKAWSSGCVRLTNEDVEDLFAYVPNGARVRILP